MPDAVVVHHNLNAIGGATRVTLETIEALHELGYRVELFTAQPPNLERIAKAYDKQIHLDAVKFLLSFKLDYLGIYQKLLTATMAPFYLRNTKADIIVNAIGDVSPHLGISDIPEITYMHFPTSLLESSEYRNAKYQKSIFWKAYFKPYIIATRHLFQDRKATSTKVILTNSDFSREAIRKMFPHLRNDLQVLYPPVDVERFSSAFIARAKKIKNIEDPFRIIIISRFSAEKQIENGIAIAKILLVEKKKNVIFEIIGALTTGNKRYFRSLQETIANDSALSNKITLRPNITNIELLDLMSRSDIYLHTMIGEHFGVSIVEAMAAGLVPIVPSYGGCTEIVPKEYQYATVEEAADLIMKNLDNMSRLRITEERNYDKIENLDPSLFFRDQTAKFSSGRFREELKKYLEQTLEMTNGVHHS